MSDYRAGINRGMPVRSAGGKKLGKVSRLEPDVFLIEKGFFFPKDYSVRYEDVQEIRSGEIILKPTEALSRDLSEGFGTSTSERLDINNRTGLNFGANRKDIAGTTARAEDTISEEELRVPVVEEELEVEHHTRDAGAVRVRKEVTTEEKQVTVPVRREEIIVDRVPVAPGTARAQADTAFDDEEIVVTAQEEEIEIHKRPVVREEVRIRKEVTQEQQTANATVRREDVKVEDSTDKNRKPPVIRDNAPKSRQR